MHRLCLFLFATPLLAQDAVAVVQKLFDGVAAHDEAMIRSVALPDARLYAIRDTGAPASSSLEDFAKRIAGMKGRLLERFAEKPQVLLHEKVAQVWGKYEFFRDGKYDHCGVDSFSLLKTEEGWKVATVVYTSEVAGCIER
jgi:hypothetical protein